MLVSLTPILRNLWARNTLQVADAALSVSEKSSQALELAKEEQERIRKQLKGNIEKYQRIEQRKNKKA